MTKNKKKIIIIDGNALIHRSFHALPPTMTTKSGEMVNAVYGFAMVLFKALREFKPDYVVLTLDKKAPTFRHEKYKEYKATRVKAPDDLYKQIPWVKKLAQVLGIPVFEMSGFEADDLIGTITAEVDGTVEKIVVTGDLDTLQLIDDNTKIYTMSRGLSDSVIYDAEAVENRFGLDIDQLIDYKGLRGDPSDNIPGVKGIGEKTAVELLKNFKTLDGVYENIQSDKIKDRIRNLLIENKDNAYLSKDLATIKRDVRIDFSLDDAKFGDFNKEEVVQLLSELEFKSLLPRIQELGFAEKGALSKEEKQEEIKNKFERNKKEFDYTLIDDEEKFESFIKKIKAQDSFAFDTETSDFDPITANLLGVSFSWKQGEAYYLNVKNKFQFSKNKVQTLFNYKDKESEAVHPWIEKIKPILENKEIKKFAHNGKFDVRVMKANGVNVKGFVFDTMIASYLLNPGTRQHGLDSVAFTELGFEKISKDDLLGKGKDKITFPEVQDEKLSLYSCEDADFTARLVKKLKPELEKQSLKKLFDEIEMPLVEVLADIEDSGIKIDEKLLSELSKKISKKIKRLEEQIYKQAGQEFNINSTQQLRKILFEKLEISVLNIKKTKTGISTSADELMKLKDAHPIIKLLQEYRELNKLITTYIDALPLLINKKTGRLHTSFNQTITATGRLSSTEPNLQNIPTRTEQGREIRKAFVSDKGCKLVALDYSQIELRLAAHMSGDKKMIQAFQSNADIHTSTAAEINQVDPETVTKQMRREAKAVNFGILYGQGAHGLSQGADIPYTRAREFIEQYFVVYKDVKKFIDKTVEEAREKGYVETLFNRRRYLPEINSSVIMVRKAAERMAVNTPLQGTAADMIKVAMIEAYKMIKKNYKPDEVKMILQVHDELIFEIKNNLVEKVSKEIKEIMENVIELKVPIIAEIKVGDNWGEME